MRLAATGAGEKPMAQNQQKPAVLSLDHRRTFGVPGLRQLQQ